EKFASPTLGTPTSSAAAKASGGTSPTTSAASTARRNDCSWASSAGKPARNCGAGERGVEILGHAVLLHDPQVGADPLVAHVGREEPGGCGGADVDGESRRAATQLCQHEPRAHGVAEAVGAHVPDQASHRPARAPGLWRAPAPASR